MSLKTSIDFPWEVTDGDTVFPTLRCELPSGSAVIVRFEMRENDVRDPGFYVLLGGSYIGGGPRDAQDAIDFAEDRIRTEAARLVAERNLALQLASAFARRVGV